MIPRKWRQRDDSFIIQCALDIKRGVSLKNWMPNTVRAAKKMIYLDNMKRIAEIDAIRGIKGKLT